jgi:hypothetical protein
VNVWEHPMAVDRNACSGPAVIRWNSATDLSTERGGGHRRMTTMAPHPPWYGLFKTVLVPAVEPVRSLSGRAALLCLRVSTP